GDRVIAGGYAHGVRALFEVHDLVGQDAVAVGNLPFVLVGALHRTHRGGRCREVVGGGRGDRRGRTTQTRDVIARDLTARDVDRRASGNTLDRCRDRRRAVMDAGHQAGR